MGISQTKKKKMTADKMEYYKSRLLQIMMGHVGKSRNISMARLYERVFSRAWDDKINDTRQLRRLITALRSDGVPICSSASHTGGGYFVASAGSELSDYCGQMRSRALGILKRESRLRKMTLPELLGQLAIDVEKAA